MFAFWTYHLVFHEHFTVYKKGSASILQWKSGEASPKLHLTKTAPVNHWTTDWIHMFMGTQLSVYCHLVIQRRKQIQFHNICVLLLESYSLAKSRNHAILFVYETTVTTLQNWEKSGLMYLSVHWWNAKTGNDISVT